MNEKTIIFENNKPTLERRRKNEKTIIFENNKPTIEELYEAYALVQILMRLAKSDEYFTNKDMRIILGVKKEKAENDN